MWLYSTLLDNVLKNLKKQRAPGLDKIANEILKIFATELAKPFKNPIFLYNLPDPADGILQYVENMKKCVALGLGKIPSFPTPSYGLWDLREQST